MDVNICGGGLAARDACRAVSALSAQRSGKRRNVLEGFMFVQHRNVETTQR